MIQVTKPFLPPKAEYDEYVAKIWEANWLTNDGPLLKVFEAEIQKDLQESFFSFVSNGTIALQLAIQALELSGEIITTPFSYVATSTSILWEKCKPVYADIDPNTWNIDPKSIEKKINPNTTAIVATHVFGNPCDIEAIQQIADKHHLKVIYDAAHAYGTLYKGKPVVEYGDLSTMSFHATKLMHTVEGGGVYSRNSALIKKINYLRNFGHDGPYKFEGVGINGKNSELHAAMGLCNLKCVQQILDKRKSDYLLYLDLLQNSGAQFQKITKGSDYNYSYFPVLWKDEKQCLKVISSLEKEKIYPRRYFYPSLDHLYSDEQLEEASANISSRIMCLPLYWDLKSNEIKKISQIINKTA